MPVTDRSELQGPLYRHIQEELRQRIVRGDWQVGQALPNRRALCAEFNTTRVTLDKAIQGLVREGWLRSEAASGTFVCAPAQGGPAPLPIDPVVRRSWQIAVVLGRVGAAETSDAAAEIHQSAMEDLFFGPLFQGIRDGLAGQPVDVRYVHIEGGDYEAFWHRTALDGTIFVAPNLRDLPILRRLAKAQIPYVAVAISSQAAREDAELPCVDTDNRNGAAMAVRHLLDLGHRRIALVNLGLSHANLHDRMEGYQRALAEAGANVNPGDLVLYPEYQGDTFESLVEEWLVRAKQAGELPTAIFACDYFMALITLRVLRRHGLRVPQDLSVVGFDDPISAADLAPPLTTVRQPTYRLGRRAASRLVDYLQQGKAGLPLQGTELFASELIVRESTCPPRSENSSIRRMSHETDR